MQKLDMRYEGKAKRVYATENVDLFVVEYKDDATAFNAQKRGTIGQKGVVNNAITAIRQGSGDFLPKPYTNDQVIQAIKQLLQAAE